MLNWSVSLGTASISLLSFCSVQQTTAVPRGEASRGDVCTRGSPPSPRRVSRFRHRPHGLSAQKQLLTFFCPMLGSSELITRGGSWPRFVPRCCDPRSHLGVVRGDKLSVAVAGTVQRVCHGSTVEKCAKSFIKRYKLESFWRVLLVALFKTCTKVRFAERFSLSDM